MDENVAEEDEAADMTTTTTAVSMGAVVEAVDVHGPRPRGAAGRERSQETVSPRAAQQRHRCCPTTELFFWGCAFIVIVVAFAFVVGGGVSALARGRVL